MPIQLLPLSVPWQSSWWPWFSGLSSGRNPVLLKPRWEHCSFDLDLRRGILWSGRLEPMVALGLQTFFMPFSGLWVSALVMATFPSQSPTVTIQFWSNLSKSFMCNDYTHGLTALYPLAHVHIHACVFPMHDSVLHCKLCWVQKLYWKQLTSEAKNVCIWEMRSSLIFF